MKLSWLDALLAVIEEGTFSEAALSLDLSQAAVSYAVAELERELGGRVLDRGRFGARPTELGLRVAEHARRIRQLTDAIGQPEGVARIPLEHPLLREISVALPRDSLRQPAVRAFLGVVRDLYPDSGIPPFALSGAVPSSA